MRNFRELLWYWQEYYLRRGRDRLSIEFSSHIPFDFWYELVQDLTADDGSPCSLLAGSIRLPKTPYAKSNEASLLLGKGLIYANVMNLFHESAV